MRSRRCRTRGCCHIFIGPGAARRRRPPRRGARGDRRGRRIAQEDGSLSPLALLSFAEAKLALRLEKDPALARGPCSTGRRTCRSVAADPVGGRDVRHALRPRLLLVQGHDQAAVLRLRSGGRPSMQEGDRILELPTAAVYLAEAEWRAGNEDAADRAADIALAGRAAPGVQPHPRAGARPTCRPCCRGASTPSRRRLAVARDRPRADRPGRAARRRPGVRRSASGTSAPGRSRSTARRGVRRSARATSCWRSSWSTGRRPASELLGALFEGRADDSARAYLRQAIQALRESLPERRARGAAGRLRSAWPTTS